MEKSPLPIPDKKNVSISPLSSSMALIALTTALALFSGKVTAKGELTNTGESFVSRTEMVIASVTEVLPSETEILRV